jgi:hypothetical protein
MSLFGFGPKKVYVFIGYRLAPPTAEQQQEIVARLTKGKTPTVLGDVHRVPDEYWNAPQNVRDAEEKATAMIHLAKAAVGSSGTIGSETHTMGEFLVTTLSGDLD